MQNDESTDEIQVETQENQTAPVEEIEAEQVVDTSQSDAIDQSTEARLAKAEAEAAKYRRLLAKAQKPKVEQPAASSSASPQLNVEETVLRAQGMPEELLSELKVIAKVRGTDLIKAQNDSLFVAVKEKFEKGKRQEAASLGASRGSGGFKPQKSINTPGLSREEHMAMVKRLS